MLVTLIEVHFKIPIQIINSLAFQRISTFEGNKNFMLQKVKDNGRVYDKIKNVTSFVYAIFKIMLYGRYNSLIFL